MLYKEWCLNVYTRKGFMIPVSTLDKILKTHHSPGYATIYSYDEEAAMEVRASGTSAGFDRFVPYSESLIIDIDDGDSGLRDAESKLQSFYYEVWESGGKGYHLVLPHNPLQDKRLPWSHRDKVTEFGILCDLSLYQSGRLLSLPGRIHPKTKRKKKYLRSHEGELITIPLIERPPSTFNFEGVEERLSTAFMRMADLCEGNVYPGIRHQNLWSLAKNMSRSGVEFEEALIMLQLLNRQWKQPKQPEEVELACKQAYKGGIKGA